MVGITNIMENTKYNKYEQAVKHVKKIRGFHRHVLIYFIINIILIVIKRIPILYVSIDNQNADQGFIDWIDINIWSTPILWGIGLLIHGLYVYRFKFSFSRTWEERKIKEFMKEDSSEENSKWE
jgi:hypothetical protein